MIATRWPSPVCFASDGGSSSHSASFAANAATNRFDSLTTPYADTARPRVSRTTVYATVRRRPSTSPTTVATRQLFLKTATAWRGVVARRHFCSRSRGAPPSGPSGSTGGSAAWVGARRKEKDARVSDEEG